MAKYNRSHKIRRRRRWFVNVGDPLNPAVKGSNPNDAVKPPKEKA